MVEWIKQLPSLIKEYNMKDIFNADETGLFYRALPTKSLAFKCSNSHGSKKVKHRITIMFCASALGEKEQPLIINTALRPRCFKNVDMSKINVHWYANKKAWMTGSIFTEWIEIFNEEMKKEKRKVLLLLDNAPCHPKNLKFSNVNVLFLPANTSSTSQPLDQGIIQSFKLMYRRRIITTLLAHMESAQNLDELIKKISLADVVEYVKEAWNSVAETTIQKCFKKCGVNCDVTENENGAEEHLIEEVIQLGQQANLDIDIQFNEDEECEYVDWEKEILDLHTINN